MSRKTATIILAIFIAFAIAHATNPNSIEYSNWVKDKLVEKSSSGLETALTNLLVPTLVKATTKTEDYYVFSIYRTQYGGNSITTVGVFDRFIPLGSQ